jgi:hypothetical protein
MCPRRRHLHLLHLQRLPRRLAHRRCATITIQRALPIQLQARKRGKAGAHVPLHLMGFATLCAIAAASRSDEATALGSLARSRCECDAMMSCGCFFVKLATCIGATKSVTLDSVFMWKILSRHFCWRDSTVLSRHRKYRDKIKYLKIHNSFIRSRMKMNFI